MGIEQRELLIAMNRIEGVVDVEHDRAGLARITLAIVIHHGRHQTAKLDLRWSILQP